MSHGEVLAFSLGTKRIDLKTLNIHSRIDNITAKAALKFGSEAWLLKKREEQR